MSHQGRKFFEDWIDLHFTGFNPRQLQECIDTNTRLLLSDAARAGVSESEIEAGLGRTVYAAVFDEKMKALSKP